MYSCFSGDRIVSTPPGPRIEFGAASDRGLKETAEPASGNTKGLGSKYKLMNMDRAIFDLKISVEATSLYILLCALMDGGLAPTLEHALPRWTGTEESLMAAARELISRCIITGSDPIPKEMHLHPTTRDKWC